MNNHFKQNTLNTSLIIDNEMFEEELQKAIEDNTLQVFSEDSLKRFEQDLQKAFDNKEISEEDLFKALRDRSHLTKKTIIRKDGKKQTVWVRTTPKETSEKTPSSTKEDSKDHPSIVKNQGKTYKKQENGKYKSSRKLFLQIRQFKRSKSYLEKIRQS